MLLYLIAIVKCLALTSKLSPAKHGIQRGIETHSALGYHRDGAVQRRRDGTDAELRYNVQVDKSHINAMSTAMFHLHPHFRHQTPSLLDHPRAQRSNNGTAPQPHAIHIKKTCSVEELIKLLSSFHVTLPTVSPTSFVTPPGPRFVKSNIKGSSNTPTPLPPKSTDNEACLVEDLIKLLSSFHVTPPTTSPTSFVTPPGPIFGKSNNKDTSNTTTPLPPKSKDNETCSVHKLVLLLSSCHITNPLTPARTFSGNSSKKGVLADFVNFSQKWAVEDLSTPLASGSIDSSPELCPRDTQSSCHHYRRRVPRRRGPSVVFPHQKNARNVRKQKGTAAGSKPSDDAAQHASPKPIPSAPLPATAPINHRVSPEPISQLPAAVESDTSTIKPPHPIHTTRSPAMDRQAPPEPESKRHPSSTSADARTANPTPLSPTTATMPADHKVSPKATLKAETATSYDTFASTSTQGDTHASAQPRSAPSPVQSNNPIQPSSASTAQQTPSVSHHEDDVPSPIARVNSKLAEVQLQLSLLSIPTMKRTTISQDSKMCGQGHRDVPNMESGSRNCILPGIYAFNESWYVLKAEERCAPSTPSPSNDDANGPNGSMANLFDVEMSGSHLSTPSDDETANEMDFETGSDTSVSDAEMAGYQTPASSEDDSEDEMDVDGHLARPERLPGNSCRLVRLRRSPEPRERRERSSAMERVIAGLPVSWEKQASHKRRKGEGQRERIAPTNPKWLPWQQFSHWSESTAALRERKMSGAYSPPR
ncbi:MAG: hypothetical protein Q9207_002791 [Kuettlingeria erythrocarpa]